MILLSAFKCTSAPLSAEMPVLVALMSLLWAASSETLVKVPSALMPISAVMVLPPPSPVPSSSFSSATAVDKVTFAPSAALMPVVAVPLSFVTVIALLPLPLMDVRETVVPEPEASIPVTPAVTLLFPLVAVRETDPLLVDSIPVVPASIVLLPALCVTVAPSAKMPIFFALI